MKLRNFLRGLAILISRSAFGTALTGAKWSAFTQATGAKFSPSDLAGLTMWYKPETLSGYNDGDPIGTWADSSGKGYDWTASGSARPTKDNSDPSANNQPSAVFVADGNCKMTNSPLVTDVINVDQQTLFIVTNSSGAGTNSIWDVEFQFGSTKNSIFLAFFGTVHYNSTDSSGGRLTVSDAGSGLHVWEFNRSGSFIEIMKDGASLASSSGASGATNGSTVSSGLGNLAYAGPIFEIVNYNVSLSSGDRTKVRGYLKTKYATP